MIRVFLLLLACVAGSWFVADAIEQKGPGYIYIYFDHYSVETSVWFAALLFIFFILLLLVLFRFIPLLVKKLMYWGYFPGWLGVGHAKKLRYQGRLAFINQHWRMANVKLAKAAKKSDSAYIDYMMAARASLQAGDADMAGIQADLAKKTNDFDAASHALLCLDIALAKGEVSKQEEIFQALLAEYASHPAVMLRIAKVYCQKGRWQALQLLLPKLKKKKFIAEQEYFDLLEAFAVGRLHELRAENQRKEIKAVWKLAARVQNRPAVVIAYSEALVAMQDIREAQKIVEAKLLGDWDESLILHYAALPLADKALQLAFAEDLLSSHSHSAGLFAALGIIAKQGGNYARARDYFFRSIQIAPQIACYEAMAEIATLQNDYAQANHYLRQALALTRH